MSGSGWLVYRKAYVESWGDIIGEATDSEDANAAMLKHARKDASTMRKLFPGRDVEITKTVTGTAPYSADQYELRLGSEAMMRYWAFAK